MQIPTQTDPSDARSTSGGPRIVIHIGLPKTATTLLQKRVFPNLPEVHYVGERLADSPDTLLVGEIKRPDWNETVARAHFETATKNAPANSRTLVISRETIASPSSIGHEGVAERYHRICSDAKILITIREPRDMLVSTFSST